MYKVELYVRVRRACMVEGMSTREAARVFGLHRDTVRKMLEYSVPPGYRRQSPPRRPKLDPYHGVIDRILEEDRRLPRKQRHTAKRIYDRLRAEHGFGGRYRCLERLGRQLRGHRETIGQRMERDLEALLAFPAVPYDASDKHVSRVSSLSLVRYRTNDYSVPVAYGHREVVVRGYVGDVVISCGAEVIARHPRSYERDDFVFDPVHYLPLLERKTGALDQAAPLAGWELPEEFGMLRRLLESRMGRRGKREFVQVLRLVENFRKEEVYEAVRDALGLGAISFDAIKHLVLCRIEGRPQRLDLELYPYLPRVTVTKTAASDYMALMSGIGR